MKMKLKYICIYGHSTLTVLELVFVKRVSESNTREAHCYTSSDASHLNRIHLHRFTIYIMMVGGGMLSVNRANFDHFKLVPQGGTR